MTYALPPKLSSTIAASFFSDQIKSRDVDKVRIALLLLHSVPLAAFPESEHIDGGARVKYPDST